MTARVADSTATMKTITVAAPGSQEAAVWAADWLGGDYQGRVITLPPEGDGELLATVVRRRSPRPDGRAVLYLHGFSDYFFQTDLADYFTRQGIDFYALDLRRHGRSLRPHHTPNYVSDLRDYFVELDAAVQIMRDDGAQRIAINAHSTGGLIAALWTHEISDRAPGEGAVEALMLNSPWFDIDDPLWVRLLVPPALELLARVLPQAVLPLKVGDGYGRSLHRDYRGEWAFDLTAKPLGGFPVRAGWLRAILQGHRQIHAGLKIRCPILVMCSTRSTPRNGEAASAASADAVLDVERVARWSVALGSRVTICRIENGIHDLVLSPAPVRESVYTEMSAWLDLHFAAEPMGEKLSEPRRRPKRQSGRG